MHVFIDESGDCGMRRKTSADYFAVAGVICTTSEMVAACEQEMQGLRTTFGLPENFEFHFARIKDRLRREFLSRLARVGFRYVACYLDKAKLQGEDWRAKAYFYEKILGTLAEASADFLVSAQAAKGKPIKARVIADDNKDPVFFKVLRARFRSLRIDGMPVVDKVGPGRSRSSDLLQLADMVCGASVRWHEGDKDYMDLLRSCAGKTVALFEKKAGDP